MANTNINVNNAPTVSTYTTLYTCGDNFMGNVIATNVSASTAKIRIAMRPLGAALATAHFLIYDYILPAGQSYTANGLALNNTDRVEVYCDVACSFNLFGVSR